MGKNKREKACATTTPARLLSDRKQRIAQRAYELYVDRGYRPGHDLDDWLEAEREIDRAA